METKKTARPFSLAFVIPGTDEAEIRGQFRRFKREFNPSRIEISLDSENGISLATVEFPPTEEGRRSFEAYQRMRLGNVQVLRDEEKPMANLKTMTPHQLAEKMVLRMKSDLRLDDDRNQCGISRRYTGVDTGTLLPCSFRQRRDMQGV